LRFEKKEILGLAYFHGRVSIKTMLENEGVVPGRFIDLMID
jgi:hypothetical protein